jgi:hypothetical protein
VSCRFSPHLVLFPFDTEKRIQEKRAVRARCQHTMSTAQEERLLTCQKPRRPACGRHGTAAVPAGEGATG